MSAHDWAIYDVRDNSTGRYFTLRTRTKGTLNAPVTVKHTRHDTFVCLTCVRNDCKHAAFVKEHVEASPALEASA